jgi:transcriptional regulator with XRE-family HTH domain
VIHLSLETPIRDLRTHLGLSQAELAKRLGVNQSNGSAGSGWDG